MGTQAPGERAPCLGERVPGTGRQERGPRAHECRGRPRFSSRGLDQMRKMRSWRWRGGARARRMASSRAQAPGGSEGSGGGASTGGAGGRACRGACQRFSAAWWVASTWVGCAAGDRQQRRVLALVRRPEGLGGGALWSQQHFASRRTRPWHRCTSPASAPMPECSPRKTTSASARSESGTTARVNSAEAPPAQSPSGGTA